jgi:tetratricopeptide (TPR) repeat protein
VKRHLRAQLAHDRPGLRKLSVEARRSSLPPARLLDLSRSLFREGERDEGLALLRWARDRHPTDFWLHLALGSNLDGDERKKPGAVELEEAIGCLRAALALRPATVAVYFNLGHALHRKGQLDEAILAYREAIRLKKDYATAHASLGWVLLNKGEMDESIVESRQAIRLYKASPEAYSAHHNLGLALLAKGQVDEAIAEQREAIRLRKDIAEFHSGLGTALRTKGLLDEAIAEHRQAILLKKDYAGAHTDLGVALYDKGQVDEAIAEYRQAIGLYKASPEAYGAHHNLGNALCDKDQLDEAILAFREAIRLKKDFADAHTGLGNALYRKGQVEEAIAEFRLAIEIKKDYALAHNNLGRALMAKGQVDEAIAAYQEAIHLQETGPGAQSPLPYLNLANAFKDKGHLEKAIASYRQAMRISPGCAAAEVRQCERFLELDGKLPGIRAGKITPASPQERIDLAQLCSLKRLHHAAARFYAEALAQEPGLANDRNAGHRYNAACAVALAGCGQGQDAGKLEDKERARLRRQALDWLRADLEAWARLLDKPSDKDLPVLLKQMRYWLVDPDFVGVRGPGAFARLPEAERPPWWKLWNDVTATRNRARALLNLKEDNSSDELAAAWRAVALYPQMPEAHFALGYWLGGRDRAGQLAAFRKAVELDPAYGLAYFRLGQTLLHATANPSKAEVEEALAAYSKFVELEPGNNGGWYNRGLAYQKLGRWQKALDDYSRAIQLISTHSAALLGRAEVRAAQGQWDRAVADYGKAIEAAESYPLMRRRAYNGLAWLLATCPDARFRDPARAVGLARQAVALMPQGSVHRYHTTLAAACYRAGDAKAALAALGESRAPDAVDWFLLALSHQKLGAPKEARKSYEQAVRWMEQNAASLSGDPVREEELRRFQTEATEVLGLKHK